MAGLRNSNGQIVIDEREAMSDVRKINQAKAKLAEVREMLNPSRLDDSRMLGETRNALSGNLTKISKELSNWEEKCDVVAKYIMTVVEKYKRIDREYASKVASGGAHSNSGFSGSRGV